MLTPQEVSARSFTKTMMGGYNMTMVDEFLDELTEDYTSLFKENASLKAKMKVLVEKVEEYRATEDSMRATLLTAQRMADSIVKEAEEKRDEILRQAENSTQEKLNGFHKEAEQYDKRLRQGQEELQRFVAENRELCGKLMKFLDEFTTLPSEEEEDVMDEIEEKILTAAEAAAPSVPETPIQEAAPVRETAPQAEAVPKEEAVPKVKNLPKAGTASVEAVFRTLVTGPKGTEEKMDRSPTPTAEKLLDTLAAAEQETEDLSATRRVNINELKFGPNYRSEGD